MLVDYCAAASEEKETFLTESGTEYARVFLTALTKIEDTQKKDKEAKQYLVTKI